MLIRNAYTVDSYCIPVHATQGTVCIPWLVLTNNLPCRLKHKQEMAGLKQDLQKLQLESKTGQKGKDLATKELEMLK